jgi:O-antigen/teichoic acid export membrane protein
VSPRDASHGRQAERAPPVPFATPRLAWGFVLSGLALGLPLIAGLWLIPLLLQSLGQVRFGLLTLCWGLLGYLAVLDLGVGRAMTKLLAQAQGHGATGGSSPLVSSGVLIALVLGCTGCALVVAVSQLLPAPILSLPPELDQEVRRALLFVAPIVPVILVSEVAKGVLEGHGRFDLSSVVRLPLGILNYAAPVIASAIVPDLAVAVASILVVRLAALVAYLGLMAAVLDERLGGRRAAKREMLRLLTLGGWMTVSSVLAPVFTYLDRFVIAVLLSVELVAFYTTPFEVVTKLTLIADALMVVAFPAVAWWAAKDAARVPILYGRFVKAALALVFPVFLVAIAFAPEFLRLWLGPRFEQESTSVLRVLAVGTLLNSLARVPFGVLQSVGRADLTAKLHLAETLPYVVALVWLTARFGIEGAAAAWALRAGVDMAALFVIAGRVTATPVGTRPNLWLAPALAAGLAASVVPIGVVPRAAIVAGVSAGLAAVAWRYLLTATERHDIRSAVSRIARGALRWQ